MNYFRRSWAVSGLTVFAASFFLPPAFYNSPGGRFLWSFDSIFLAESPGETLVFIAICLAIAYPYLWAAITAGFFLSRSPGRWAVRSQFICHILGGLPIASLGVALLWLRSDFPDPAAQWLAALAPAGLLLILAAAAGRASGHRRFPALVFLALLFFTPLQFFLRHYIRLDGGAGWGYLIGGTGGALGLLGSFSCLLQIRAGV